MLRDLHDLMTRLCETIDAALSEACRRRLVLPYDIGARETTYGGEANLSDVLRSMAVALPTLSLIDNPSFGTGLLWEDGRLRRCVTIRRLGGGLSRVGWEVRCAGLPTFVAKVEPLSFYAVAGIDIAYSCVPAANVAEARFYRACTDDVRDRLATPLCWSESARVMAFELVPHKWHDGYHAAGDTADDFFTDLDIVVDDVHEHNLRLMTEDDHTSWRAIDYATWRFFGEDPDGRRDSAPGDEYADGLPLPTWAITDDVPGPAMGVNSYYCTTCMHIRQVGRDAEKEEVALAAKAF